MSHVSLADDAQIGDVHLLGVNKFTEHVLALLDDSLDALSTRRVRLIFLLGVTRATRSAVLLLDSTSTLSPSSNKAERTTCHNINIPQMVSTFFSVNV